MRVTPIRNPDRDERIIAVHPDMTFPEVEGAWTHRLNLFTGRALTDRALSSEQLQRGRRLAALAQQVSRGVVRGLEVSLEPPAGSATDWFYQISEGSGIAASGEDVQVLRARRLRILDVPVYAPAALVGGIDSDTEADEEAREPEEGELLRRHIGPPLGELLADGEPVPLPRAGVLVLQPIVAEMVGEFDSDDPCERDPADDAFDDWQLADGCRVVLYLWPSEWLSLPPRASDWRNVLAHAVFEREEALGPNEIMPWEQLGVPIATVGFENDWTPQFVDRYSVVRAGGKPLRRAMLLSNAGNRFLWQARIEQFADHIAAMTADSGEIDPQQFRFLPPVGVLPTTAMTSQLFNDVHSFSSDFFPSFYDVETVPVPVEQLDTVVEASAPLQRLDLGSADAEDVRIYVPVPQIYYEPSLLRHEALDPEFQEQLDEFLGDRAEALQRRGDVRDKTDVLTQALRGAPIEYPDPDPGALEEEDIGTEALDPPEEDYGTEIIAVSGTPTRVAQALETLRTELTNDFPFTAQEIAGIDQDGLEAFVADLERTADQADDTVDFRFVQVQAAIHQVRQLMLGETKASRLATSSVLSSIAKGSSARATRQQIREYFEGARGQTVPTSGAASSGASGPTFGARTFVALPPATGPSFPTVPSLPTGPAAPVTIPVSQILQVQSLKATSALFLTAAKPNQISIGDVIGQTAIVGKADQFRTVTVAQRLEQSPANEAWEFAVSTKYETIQKLAGLPINLSDIRVVGMQPPTGRADPNDNGPPTFGELNDPAVPVNVDDILSVTPPPDGDEAEFLGAAVQLLDEAVITLRRTEGRIQSYRDAITRTNEVIAALATHISNAAQRLRVLGDTLAETRHDVAVARALIAEEQARIDRVNERRQEILSNHVPFLAFARPRVRLAETDESLPVRPLDPGLVESPVPSCLRRPVDPPTELQGMIDVFRDAPARWFPKANGLLVDLNRLDVLNRTLRTSIARAGVRAQTLRQEQPGVSAGAFLPAVSSVLQARRQVALDHRNFVHALNVSTIAADSLTLGRRRAQEIVTLGDLIDGDHARASIARRAAAELENISSVATCLYVAFSEVNPRFRLLWAERLSQHDDPVNLRNLGSLPRWGDLDFEDRFELQAMVDWLYQRIDPREGDATELMSDLVRVCLLVASHAPVNKIIAGSVSAPTTVTVGGRVEVAVDLTRVRAGMHVLMYAGNQPVARGVVDDLSVDHVTARIFLATQPNVLLEQGARVQFAEPVGLDSNPITAPAAFAAQVSR